MTAVIYRNQQGREKIFYYKKMKQNIQTDYTMALYGFKKVKTIEINNK